MRNSSRAVVLLSGGLDSTVCATLACQVYPPSQVFGLFIYYGQRHDRESDSASKVSQYLKLGGLDVISIPKEIFSGSGCSLLWEAEVPQGPYPESLGPLNTYVPFRNGVLLSIASAFSQKVGAEAIYFGAHSEDANNWAYPDCTPEFLGAVANAIHVGTYFKTRLITPLQWLTKREIVRLGLEIGAPMWLTWSCYQGGDEPCGVCPTCISRREAFKANRVDEETYICLQGHIQLPSHEF